MVVQGSQERRQAPAVSSTALRALVEAVRAALAGTPSDALSAFARAAAEACGADAAVVRLPGAGGAATARAVHAVSPLVAAQLEGTRGAAASALEFRFAAPVAVDGAAGGELEVLRAGSDFTHEERLVAELAAGELALVLRALGGPPRKGGASPDARLVLAGEALAAGADGENAPDHVVRLAAEASGAEAVLLWRAAGTEPERAAAHGESSVAESALLSAARVALDSRTFLVEERIGGTSVANVRLGEPAIGVLQLVYADDLDDETLAGLSTFALRAAQALRASDRARETTLELERARALVTVAGEATAQLSLAHTLSIAIEHTSALLGASRAAVYLRDGARLQAVAARNLAGPHAVVAERLLALALGAHRGRGLVSVAAFDQEPVLEGAREAAEEAGIVAALVLPLTAGGEVFGLLAVYPEEDVRLAPQDETLLSAVASQLAVAVQNARLHEQSKTLVAELDEALRAERDSARRVRALYEVSQSFAQSLSLEATLDALARSAVELLGVDAAAIRMPDPRREALTTRALHIGDERIESAARSVLSRPQPFAALPLQRLFRTRAPLSLTPPLAVELGGSHRLLAPFLEKGSTAAVLPIATPAEVVATLTLVSFDPGRPITPETIETGLSIAAQAALAIDNGRLYQQQKEFAETMQRSLLPRTHPQLEGLEIGEVYESAARVDVGGDVYDFVELADGTLAVVLGDVTGHGIEATADMAMAKFVFRSLAREHPGPGDFLASANEVVVGEIAPGKFITMIYLTVEPRSGKVVAACAGHPAPLLVSAGGAVTQLDVHGLALGVDSGQAYEEAEAVLAPGDCAVVFTHGVFEARRGGELYGTERLIEVLASVRGLAPGEIARAVIDDCRAFAGELADDCAVVVIKKPA